LSFPWRTRRREQADITKGTSEWEGWGTALKPACEPCVLARKPLSEKTVALNVLKWGTGGINIDGSRVESGDKLARPFNEANNDILGKYEKFGNPIEPLGRFPANIIHDGSDEVLEVFPNDTHRFFYSAKTSKSERNKGCEELEEKQTQGGGGGIGDYQDDVNSMSGKYGSEKAPAKNNHPTVKPQALMKYLITLITPKGGTVLDPFAGSGSTLVAAKDLGFGYIGIEMTAEYIPIIEARLAAVQAHLPL